MYYTYLFWSKDTNLDNNVGEFILDKKLNWNLIKIRDDRKIDVDRGNYFGNNYKIAELIWMSYKDPLIIEDLKEDMYFRVHESKKHEAQRNYNSFC